MAFQGDGMKYIQRWFLGILAPSGGGSIIQNIDPQTALLGLYEFEVRYRSELSKKKHTFGRIKDHLRRMGYIPRETTHTNRLYEGNVRQEGEGKFVNKVEKSTWILDEVGSMKASLAIEKPMPDAPSLGKEILVRLIKRSSYELGPHSRMDVSETRTTDRMTDSWDYEYELEYTGGFVGDYTPRIKSFLVDVIKFIRIIQGTIVPYSDSMYDLVWNSFELGVHLAENSLPNARNLKIHEIRADVMKDYTITHKADGEGRIMVCEGNNLWLLNPLNRTANLVLVNPAVKSWDGTIIQGEEIRRGKRNPGAPDTQIWFLVFDCLIYCRRNLMSLPLLSRLDAGSGIRDLFDSLPEVRSTFVLTMKNFTPVGQEGQDPQDVGTQFFSTLEDYYQQQPGLAYHQDGFMLTPNSVPYSKLDLKILKIKPVEHMTVDLKVVRDGPRQELRHGGGPWSGAPVDWDGKEYPDGTIVEIGWREVGKTLEVRRVRWDKLMPNAARVVEETWKDMRKPLTRDLLTGKDFSLVYKYHNRIKEALLTSVDYSGLVLLDLGSGRGGDMDKWGLFRHVYAVEPNASNAAEFRRRLKSHRYADRITLIECKAEDTRKILEVMDSTKGRAQVCSMMLSMSFFWQSSSVLQSLLTTVWSGAPGGKLVCFSIDGSLVRAMMKTGDLDFKGGFTLGTNRFQYFPAKDGENEGLYIDLPGTIVGRQKEWLVDYEDLEKAGFTMNSLPVTADTEDLLTKDQKIYSRMYSSCEFSIPAAK